MNTISTGQQARYIIGRTQAGKDIPTKHPVTVVRYTSADRVVVRNSPEEFTAPNAEWETWASRLRAI